MRLWDRPGSHGGSSGNPDCASFLSVSRYKSRITQLISASLGRPVRLILG